MSWNDPQLTRRGDADGATAEGASRDTQRTQEFLRPAARYVVALAAADVVVKSTLNLIRQRTGAERLTRFVSGCLLALALTACASASQPVVPGPKVQTFHELMVKLKKGFDEGTLDTPEFYARELGYRIGTRINIDVLNAQQQLHAAQRDLFKARADTLMHGLRLKAAAGLLDAGALQPVNDQLAAATSSSTNAPKTLAP